MSIAKRIFNLLLLAAMAMGAVQGDVHTTYNGSALVIIAEDNKTSIPSVDSDNDAGNSDSSGQTCESLTDAFTSKGLKNGTDLSLLLAIPLTYMGKPYLNPGFFQLAAALMAIDHFNERNPAVVPELSDIQDCPIRMAYDDLIVMDTGVMDTNAMNTLLRTLDAKKQLPNAVCGGYDEIPAIELSVLASVLKVPMVNHRGLDHNMLIPQKHPYVTQVNPDLYSDMQVLGDYLQYIGRTDYIAVLYASSADISIQRLEVFRGVAQSLNMKNIQAFGYVSPATPVDTHRAIQNISTAMESLKASGYRTIVWLSPYFADEMIPVGIAAHQLELDRGDHFWIIGTAIDFDGPADQNSPGKGTFKQTEDVENVDESDLELFLENFSFLRNAAFLHQADFIFAKNTEDSPFMEEWMRLNETFITKLGNLNPIPFEDYQREWNQSKSEMGWVYANNFPDGLFPPEDLFARPVEFLSSPPSGATNLYDAIMAIGFGACRAASLVAETTLGDETSQGSNKTNVTWSGDLLQDSIRSSHFSGATGEIKFGGGFPGSRMGSTVTYHIMNLFPTGFFSDLYAISKVRNATDGQWYEVHPFIYADGTTSPPKLLRDPADQNYLSDGVRAAGLALMSGALFTIFISFVWVAMYRHHRIVVASQPIFLYFICLGSSMTALSILFLSFDESHGWNEEQLTKACKALPWLVILGHIFTYNCLFTKLWRVNRVLTFSRRKVNLIHMLWPAWLIELTAFVLLSVWTAKTDYHWEREEIDVVTGESMGSCSGTDEYAFFVPVGILVMIPTLLTGLMAWKTIDVDAAYSEAKWIFALMLVQCQVIIVAVPMLLLMSDVSTDGRFLGSALILWSFPMTTMGLIFWPKMFAVHFPPDGNRKTRGSSGGTRISGLATPQEEPSRMTTSSMQCQVTTQSGDSSSTQPAVTALTHSTRLAHVTVQ